MKVLDSIYRITERASYLQTPLLFLIRLYWGLAFVYAGLSKLQDIQRVRDFFASLSIPQPLFNAFFVASTETICGTLLAIGFLSRLASIPLIVTMSVAYATAHSESLKELFVDPTKFLAESPFTFLFASLLILVFGPGKLSIDYFLGKEK